MTVCCGAQLPICFLFTLEAMHVSGLEVEHTSGVLQKFNQVVPLCVFLLLLPGSSLLI